MNNRIDRGKTRAALPFRVVGIVQEKTRLARFLERAGSYGSIGFGLMPRDPEHRRDRVEQLALDVSALNRPPNVTLISNGCDVKGIAWRHLTEAEWKSCIAAGSHPSKAFGCSVHLPGDVRLAGTLEPNYLLVSPIFPTTSKLRAHAIGVEALRECVEKTSIPIIALGGITSVGRARQCFAAGAHGIAGISLFDDEHDADLAEVLNLLSAGV